MEDYYGIKSRRAREYIRSLPFKKRIPFSAMFPKTSPQALDLLEKLLAFNPAKRITVEEALKHPYLEPYHDPEDEPTAAPIPDEFFDFDRRKDDLSKEQLKSKSDHLRPDLIAANIPLSPHLRRDHAVKWVWFFGRQERRVFGVEMVLRCNTSCVIPFDLKDHVCLFPLSRVWCGSFWTWWMEMPVIFTENKKALIALEIVVFRV